MRPEEAVQRLSAGRSEWKVPAEKEWDVSMPSRGLGDTVAKITHATGIAQVVHAVSAITGHPCGCPERQEALNKAVPYATHAPAA